MKMELKYRVLEHPFYQSWTKGEITLDQLAKYHKSYAGFIENMPVYWQKINDTFNPESTFGKKVVADETHHIELWEKWAPKLPAVNEFPTMQSIIDELDAMNPSQLLGAIQAFEMQQPEVAKTKKEGLLCHYNMTEAETVYFDDHMEEEAHIAYGASLKARFANQEDFEVGFNRGAELFYKGLDMYLN